MNATRHVKLLTLLRQCMPIDPLDLRQVGIHYEFLGSGVYREVYWLKGYNVIIKFPFPDGNTPYRDSEDSSLGHAQREMDGFEKIRASKSPLRNHLPKIYYQNRENGVIVMEKYNTDWMAAYNTKTDKSRNRKVMDLRRRLCRFFKLNDENSDYGADNFGLDKHGKFVIVDLGIST